MNFFDERELETFEGWVKYQSYDLNSLTQDQLDSIREMFAWVRTYAAAMPPVGVLEYKGAATYGVAIEDEGLWLALVVRRNTKREVFVLRPHGPHGGDSHLSYHRDGRIHRKSNSVKSGWRSAQRLDDHFKGVEHLGSEYGYGPRSIGAVCEPSVFTDTVVVPAGVLGPRDGHVNVDVLAPGEPVPTLHTTDLHGKRIVAQRVFKDVAPWVAITVVATHDSA